MENMIFQDICEVYLRDLKTDAVSFLGLNTKNDINQKVTQEVLKGGIGMKSVAVLNGQKEIDFSVTTLTHSDIVWMIQSGSGVTSGTYTVQKNEKLECIDGTFTIVGTAVGTTCIAIDGVGKQTVGTIALQVATITTPVEGDYYTILYSCEVVGTAIEFNATKFPSSYYVEMHTIAYKDNIVIADIYYLFKKATPDGNVTGTFEGNKNTGDTMKFTALAPDNSDVIAQYLVIPRIVV